MEPIRRTRSLSEDAYRSIKESILRNDLEPGQQLKEEELASELGISATPLREALAMLQREGFVKVIPYRGKFVTKVTPELVRDIYEVRRTLEGLATELATPHIPDEELEELEMLFDETAQRIAAGDFDLYFKSDSALHKTIVKHSQNKWLMRTLEATNDHVRRIRAVSLALSGSHIHRSFDEHYAILAALKNRDRVKAREAMAEHVQKASERIAELLGSGEELTGTK